MTQAEGAIRRLKMGSTAIGALATGAVAFGAAAIGALGLLRTLFGTEGVTAMPFTQPPTESLLATEPGAWRIGVIALRHAPFPFPSTLNLAKSASFSVWFSPEQWTRVVVKHP
jgi:hypothetical protein